MSSLKDFLPHPPWAGPPLPRLLGLRWQGRSPFRIYPSPSPLKEMGIEEGAMACVNCFNPDSTILDRDIIELHKQNLSATEIAARLGVAPELIRYRLRRLGFEPIVAPRFLKAEADRKRVLELHEERYSAKEISEQLKLDLSRVYRILREGGVVPRPTREEIENTLRELDEIIRLGKETASRHQIAREVKSTWPLVTEVLQKSSVRGVSPACAELTEWLSSLSPIINEIRAVVPDTAPILEKVNELEKELTAIYEATGVVERGLPWRGREADRERWCVGNVSSVAYRSLDLFDALRSCLRTVDMERLPTRIEQGKRCVENITSVMAGGIKEVSEPGR